MKKWLLLVGVSLFSMVCFSRHESLGNDTTVNVYSENNQSNYAAPSTSVLQANNFAVVTSPSEVVNSQLVLQPYFFTAYDWQNLWKVFNVYANSGLTCWVNANGKTVNNGQVLYDYEIPALIEQVTNASFGTRSDNVRDYASVTGNTLNAKSFLKNQSTYTQPNPQGDFANAGWDAVYLGGPDIETVQNFIQSGFANSVAQYSAALIENFAGRIAVAASFFQSSASGNNLVTQKNSGFLGYTNATQQLQTLPYSLPTYNISNPASVYNEQAILSNCMSLAQTVFQRARYARMMYQFSLSTATPQVANAFSLIKNTSGNDIAQPAALRAGNSSILPTSVFTLPTNTIDLDSSGLTMVPTYNVLDSDGSPVASQPLGPVSTFCGVILINATEVVNQAGVITQQAFPLAQMIGSSPCGPLTYDSALGGMPYAPVYFLPAVSSSVGATPTAACPYDNYQPVDQSMPNVTSQTNGSPSTVIEKTVSFNTQVGGAVQGYGAYGSTITIMVTNQSLVNSYQTPQGTSLFNAYAQGPFGVFGQDPVGIVLQEASNIYPLLFSSNQNSANDFQNFFAYPTQWALVLKLAATTPGSNTVQVLGLVKLNPYDFPLNFTTSSMEQFLGVPSQGQNFGDSSINAGGMQSLLTAATTATTFSQQDVWNGVADLYSTVFPAGYNTTPLHTGTISQIKEGAIPYPFSYLVLQGLMNGYLMSNTYNVMFNMTNWPNLNQKNVNSEYDTYYGKNGYYSSQMINFVGSSSAIIMDQVFPTPLTSDWLGGSSPLDWFYLRTLMATRLVLQSIYCPFDALVLPVSQLYTYSLSNGQNGVWNFDNNNYLNLTEPATQPTTGANVSEDPIPSITPIPSINQMSCLLEYLFYNTNQTISVQIGCGEKNGEPNTAPYKYRSIYGQNYASGSTNANATSYQWILPYTGNQPALTINTPLS